jgi:protein gp37
MTTVSRIEWTEQTWNPAIGCTKVSAGCKHCYAETLAKRLQAMGVAAYEHGFRLKLLEDRLDQPIQRKKPTVYFVNSMSDLFHERIPDQFIDNVMATITNTPHHRYQILTKRHERLGRYFASRSVPSNVWLGESVENRRHGVPRIDVLRQIPAKIRFLSCEPLLEDLGPVDLSSIHWVIVGGESGRKARPMHADWARTIRTQCEAQGATFFFKQWGGWGADGQRRSKKANGRELDGRQWNGMPNTIAVPVA